MNPTPVTTTPPGMPAAYAWEATDEAIAARYGLALDEIVRFDLNTLPATPGYVFEILAAGRFETPLADYPPGDYGRLVAAAAEAYGVRTDEIVPGAGADEVLDLCARAFLPPGGSAVVAVPSYAMYRVITEQRPARLVEVARRGPAEGHRLDPGAVRAAARTADLVWLCNPNNPTGQAEPPGAIEDLLDGLAADAARGGQLPPLVVLDEAYAEFVGASLLGLRERYPRLVVVRTASKAYGLAGFRVGFAIGTRETIARLAVYRPPGSISTVSATVVAEGLRRAELMRANVAAIVAERGRLAAGLEAAGWSVAPSVTNFVAVDFGSPGRAARVAEGLLRRGLVPRTFGAGHPFAGHLRLTARTPADDDRLIAAAAEISAQEER
jgi:histidinol-phosphate aminotransferase